MNNTHAEQSAPLFVALRQSPRPTGFYPSLQWLQLADSPALQPTDSRLAPGRLTPLPVPRPGEHPG